LVRGQGGRGGYTDGGRVQNGARLRRETWKRDGGKPRGGGEWRVVWKKGGRAV